MRPAFLTNQTGWRTYHDSLTQTWPKLESYYRARLQTLLAVDEMVARLVSTLEQASVPESTDIIFSSDIGYALGKHRIMREKGSAYSESRVLPLVVRV